MNIDVDSRRQVRFAAAVTLVLTVAMALAGILNGPAPVAAVLEIVCILAATVSPIGAVGAVVIVLPWFYHPVPVGNSHVAASELLLFAAIAGYSLRTVVLAFLHRDIAGTLASVVRSWSSSRLLWLIGGLALLGFLLVVLPYDLAPRSDALREWRWTLFEPLLFIGLLVVVGRERPWHRAFLAGCLIAAATAAAIDGLSDLVTGAGVEVEGVRRIAGPYPHANALALFVLRGFILASGLWLFRRGTRPWLAAPVLILGAAVVATYSRGAIAAATLVLLLAIAVVAPRLRWVALIVVACGGAGLAIVAGGRMLDAFGGGSASLRIDIWRSAVAMIRDRPVLGYGPDGFLYAYNPRYVWPAAWAERFTSHAHNLILDYWIRLGIIGGAFAVFVTGYLVVSTVRFVRSSGARDVIADATLLALVATMLHGMVDNAYFAHDLAMSAWLLAWLAFESCESVAEKGAVVVASSRRWRLGVHRVPLVR